MNREQLHARVDELHRELRSIDEIDAAERERLEALMADIRALLAHDYETRGRELRERVRSRIAEIEAAHPRATTLLGDAMDVLAGIGL
jgi:hypothetical protein